MDKELKSLLIRSNTQKSGSQGVWNELDKVESYVRGINTGQFLDDLSADKINALISGIPSPWARAKLFKFAFDAIAKPDANLGNNGLEQFYQRLVGEWKGLVAVLALFGDRIRFSDPVYMPLDGANNNIASAFGRMLFSDKDLWSNPEQPSSSDTTAQPYIQLIYYNSILIGGTSPLTAFFTGIDYSKLTTEGEKIPWYKNNAFKDPMESLKNASPLLQKVYLFVRNMRQNAEAFEKAINSKRNGKENLDLTSFIVICTKWIEEIEEGWNGEEKLADKGTIAQYDNLQCPFSILLDSRVPVYKRPDGIFTYTNDDGYVLIDDIQKLLSTENYVVGWSEARNAHPKLSEGMMHYLTVSNNQTGDCYYFTLPLSEQGLDLFQGKLDGLLNGRPDSNARLQAEMTLDGKKLVVTMEIEIDNDWTQLNKKEYNISWQQIPGKVILWPNFVSDNWNKYYLYSEFTSDAKQRFVPIFNSGGRLLKDANDHVLTAEYIPPEGQPNPVRVTRLVSYVDEALPKYDITEFNKPIIGLEVKAQDGGIEHDAGYLVLRSDRLEPAPNLMLNAVVGFDFGSNNTCVYYNANNQGPMPVEFENYRIVMVGRENKNMRSIATNDELLFFSNYPSNDGQVKSWLHEHNPACNANNQTEEISGGVPVHRTNVLVKRMTPFEIETQAGKMHYNMKWLDDDSGRRKKLAFLKTIWVHTCAYLYTHQINPIRIEWSYPGSMMESDRNYLETAFTQLPGVTPIVGAGMNGIIGVATYPNLYTESEAVCRFALGGDYALGNNNIILGIDVGGSTSDILLLAKDLNNYDTLMRESSVRMAAGVFFNTIIKSTAFRDALIRFHESDQVDNLHVENLQEIRTHGEKAPYYLNNIFDQLRNDEEYDALYTCLNQYAKQVFAIPAYVTGMLLFYSGMMIGKAIQDNGLNNVEQVDVFSFGKGGRLFHWLYRAAAQYTVDTYYTDCVNAGLACICENKQLTITYHNERNNTNKTEVAQGLCNNQMNLRKAPQAADCDICGECNVSYTDDHGLTRQLSVDEELNGSYFVNGMNRFTFHEAENLERFSTLFFDFIENKTDIYQGSKAKLAKTIESLPNHFKTYITNHDPEYAKALNNRANGFHYHQPIIVAEALYLQSKLIELLF